MHKHDVIYLATGIAGAFVSGFMRKLHKVRMLVCCLNGALMAYILAPFTGWVLYNEVAYIRAFVDASNKGMESLWGLSGALCGFSAYWLTKAAASALERHIGKEQKNDGGCCK